MTRLLWLLPVLGLLLLGGCRQQEQQHQTVVEQTMLTIDGFEIPAFSSPEQQLQYSRSVQEEPARERAALLAVGQLFPRHDVYRGLAALDLAYLGLGPDYRFAARQDVVKAAQRYQKILTEYADYTEVAVKALWYLGWLHCDLLGEKRKGIDFYKQVVNSYPEAAMGGEVPQAEVLSLYAGSQQQTASSEGHGRNYWATSALVEIAGNSIDPQEIHWALQTLAGRYRNPIATGIAIRTVLRNGQLPPQSEPLVSEFLSDARAEECQKHDIRRALAARTQRAGQ